MSQLSDWANDWCVSDDAMAALYQIMGFKPDTPVELEGKNEAYVQSAVRLAAPMAAMTLFRNNVGALKDERGVPIRFGLGNDTAALNKVFKTGDLAGWQSGWFRDYETLEPVKVAVFAMAECKKAGWKMTPTNAHEIAQLRAINMVQAGGGIACFTTGGLPVGVRFPALTDKAPEL